MKLIILGSGTYQPELNRHSAGYLVKVGRQNIVFDFGRGTLDQLLRAGVHYHHIDAIFITHTHPDHFSEITSFLHIALAEPAKGQLRRKNVTIYGPPGIKKVVDYLLKAFNLWGKVKPKYKVIIKELTADSRVQGKGWTVQGFLAKHIAQMDCFSYRIKSGSKVLAYSGDTEDCPGVRRACHQANVAVIETSWPAELNPTFHLTGGEVGKIAQAEGVKKVVATHVAPYYLQKFDVKKEIKQTYKGPVVIAKDLMKIKV